jgi:hypothetical protein
MPPTKTDVLMLLHGNARPCATSLETFGFMLPCLADITIIHMVTCIVKNDPSTAQAIHFSPWSLNTYAEGKEQMLS